FGYFLPFFVTDSLLLRFLIKPSVVRYSLIGHIYGILSSENIFTYFMYFQSIKFFFTNNVHTATGRLPFAVSLSSPAFCISASSMSDNANNGIAAKSLS